MRGCVQSGAATGVSFPFYSRCEQNACQVRVLALLGMNFSSRNSPAILPRCTAGPLLVQRGLFPHTVASRSLCLRAFFVFLYCHFRQVVAVARVTCAGRNASLICRCHLQMLCWGCVSWPRLSFGRDARPSTAELGVLYLRYIYSHA